MTTFRLYTEMLSEGMVADEPTRATYIKTLRTEAERLGHLVENVLAYARLERGRATKTQERVNIQELLSRVAPQLERRAEQAGMQLTVNSKGTEPAVLCTDTTVVGQILLNLVDNAAKYASTSSERKIHVDIEAMDARVDFSVRDYGPGVEPRVTGRLFRPFSKSATEAASSAPGIGLGLAISRRLARDLGGDLYLRRDNEAGACFVLTLPRQ
jgi:signal transduction histidine kinase